MHWKNGKRFISTILSTAMLITSISSIRVSADAYKYRFDVNLSNMRIYYSDSYANNYGLYTMRAAFLWCSDSRLKFIHPVRVSSSSESDVFCRMYSVKNDGVYAMTNRYYDGYSKGANASKRNWDHCIIKVNNSYNVQIDTLTHEFGHVLGLDHDSNVNSIMCPHGMNRVATKPSYSEFTLIYKKYSPYYS